MDTMRYHIYNLTKFEYHIYNIWLEFKYFGYYCKYYDILTIIVNKSKY